MIWASSQSAPINSVQELIKIAKARPGTLKYASAGSGSPMHMGGEIFKDLTGTDIHSRALQRWRTRIDQPYQRVRRILHSTLLPRYCRRSAPADSSALAIARESRLAKYPNIPTFIEAGLPRYEANAWYSMHAPAGTPATVIAKINRELVKAIALPDVVEKLRQLGSDGVGDTPAHFGAFVRAELDKYAGSSRKPASASNSVRFRISQGRVSG